MDFGAFSFDHLVTGASSRMEFEAERLGSLEIEHELELCRLHDRKVGRLLALENPAGVDAGLAIGVGQARPVTHQAAGHTARDRYRSLATHGEPPARQSFPMGVQERAGPDEQRAGPTPDERLKGGLDVAVTAAIENDELLPDPCAAVCTSFRSARS